MGKFSTYKGTSLSIDNFIVYKGNFTDRHHCLYHRKEVDGWDFDSDSEKVLEGLYRED